MSTALTVIQLNTALDKCSKKLLDIKVPTIQKPIALPDGVLDFNGVYREVENKLLETDSIFKIWEGRPAKAEASAGGIRIDLGTVSGLVVAALEAIRDESSEFVDTLSYDVHHTIYRKEVVEIIYKAIKRKVWAELSNIEAY